MSKQTIMIIHVSKDVNSPVEFGFSFELILLIVDLAPVLTINKVNWLYLTSHNL